jgi:hypothetical protein
MRRKRGGGAGGWQTFENVDPSKALTGDLRGHINYPPIYRCFEMIKEHFNSWKIFVKFISI